jgi:hypothetical protein
MAIRGQNFVRFVGKSADSAAVHLSHSPSSREIFERQFRNNRMWEYAYAPEGGKFAATGNAKEMDITPAFD